MPQEKMSKKRKQNATNNHWVCELLLELRWKDGKEVLTARVSTCSMIEIMTMQKEQPAALSIMTFRRPAFSMKK